MIHPRKRFEPRHISVVKGVEPIGFFDDLKARSESRAQEIAEEPPSNPCPSDLPIPEIRQRTQRPPRKVTGRFVYTRDGGSICTEACAQYDTCALRDPRRKKCALFTRGQDVF